MKKLLTAFFLVAMTSSLTAQLRLDVQGDAKIVGKLDLQIGLKNVFIGFETGLNATGGFNTFVGETAGKSNIDGSSNTFIGDDAGELNTSGRRNTFLGQDAGSRNTIGEENTFIGENAGDSNTTGSFNTFIGRAAGSGTNDDLENAIAIGHEAEVRCDNCAVIGGVGVKAVKVGIGTTTPQTTLHLVGGADASLSDHGYLVAGPITGKNIVMDVNEILARDNGEKSPLFLQTDGGSVSIGSSDALTDLHLKQSSDATTGSGGITLERSFGGGGKKWKIYNNALDLSFAENNFSSNSSSEQRAYIETGTGDYEQPSDARLKKNVERIDEILPKVLQLKPSRYHYKSMAASSDKTMGFIAQEVQSIFPEIVSKSADGTLALAYKDFGILAIKAIQELATNLEGQTKENSILTSKIEEQQAQLNNLEEATTQQQAQISELKSLVEKLLTQNAETPPTTSYVLPLEQEALLAQNQPNPFNENTLVDYFIPATVKTAHIQVMAFDGKVIGKVAITEMGKGQITIQSKSYPASTYFYSLVLDGEVQITKKMIIAR